MPCNASHLEKHVSPPVWTLKCCAGSDQRQPGWGSVCCTVHRHYPRCPPPSPGHFIAERGSSSAIRFEKVVLLSEAWTMHACLERSYECGQTANVPPACISSLPRCFWEDPSAQTFLLVNAKLDCSSLDHRDLNSFSLGHFRCCKFCYNSFRCGELP